jgi:hypothetical protein
MPTSFMETFAMKSGLVHVCAIALAYATPAIAHHSFAMFDNQKEVTVAGVVREFQWTNPHCWLRILTTDETGKEVEWNIEGQSTNILVRAGWSRDSVKPGDKAVVVIHPLKDGSNGGSLFRLTINGHPMTMGGPSSAPPSPSAPP